MNKKRNSQNHRHENYRRYKEPPPKLHLDPTGVTAEIKGALNYIVPIFLIKRPKVTAPMVAWVMRVSELYKDANNDDVANVLLNLNIRPTLENGNAYFNLSSYIIEESKPKTILRRKED